MEKIPQPAPNADTSLAEVQRIRRKKYQHEWYLEHKGKKYNRLPPRVITACAACGKTLSLQPNQKEDNNYCNYKCMGVAMSKRRGEDSNRWKGGKTYQEGYADIRLQPGDPFFPMISGTRTYIREHRLVMAKKIGRCLHPWEIVHHINGDRADNRIENLQLIGMHGQHNTMIEKYIKKLENEIARLKNKIAELEGK